MTTALIGSSTVAQQLFLTDCTACALWHALQSKGRSWCLPSAALAVDGCAGAVLLGNVSEVLVPLSLVEFVEAERGGGSVQALLPEWDSLKEDRALVVLASAQDALLRWPSYLAYHKLCVPVPGGPLISRMAFSSTFETFHAKTVPQINAATVKMGSHYQWRAWVRSALTCRYEGEFVSPIRTGELALDLLGEQSGAAAVILEQGILGLTGRRMETALKTAAACGVPAGQLGVALCGEQNTSQLLFKCTEAGVRHVATSFLAEPLFAKTDPLEAPEKVAAFVERWNRFDGSADDEEVADAQAFHDFGVTFRKECHKLLRGDVRAVEVL